MEFHERLKLLRKKKGITQKKLAEKLGYGYTAICNYESKRNEPNIRDLIKLADVFDVSLDYLVCRDRTYLEMINGNYMIISKFTEEEIVQFKSLIYRLMEEREIDK